MATLRQPLFVYLYCGLSVAKLQIEQPLTVLGPPMGSDSLRVRPGLTSYTRAAGWALPSLHTNASVPSGLPPEPFTRTSDHESRRMVQGGWFKEFDDSKTSLTTVTAHYIIERCSKFRPASPVNKSACRLQLVDHAAAASTSSVIR